MKYLRTYEEVDIPSGFPPPNQFTLSEKLELLKGLRDKIREVLLKFNMEIPITMKAKRDGFDFYTPEWSFSFNKLFQIYSPEDEYYDKFYIEFDEKYMKEGFMDTEDNINEFMRYFIKNVKEMSFATAGYHNYLLYFTKIPKLNQILDEYEMYLDTKKYNL